ncbi:hypothetical protein GGH16_001717, partial [Coemansia sp. RSA 560]
MTEQKPIHYFVCSEDSHARCHYKATEVNSILEYFDSKDDVDLAKLADIVKSKPYCVQKYFIINKGTEYRAVETNNVENTFIFNFEHRSSIVRALVAGTATIDTLIEKYKRLEYKFANPERQAGFKLRDSNGKIIPDGKEFAIQILRDPGEGSDEEETKGFSSGEFPFHNKDWIDINDSMEDGNDYFLFGHPDGGDIFECETIDDIVYLKHNGGYLYFDVDDQLDDIFIGKAVPTKEQRIQIHYTDDGYICLTGWGGRVYVSCEWIKDGHLVMGETQQHEAWAETAMRDESLLQALKSAVLRPLLQPSPWAAKITSRSCSRSSTNRPKQAAVRALASVPRKQYGAAAGIGRLRICFVSQMLHGCTSDDCHMSFCQGNAKYAGRLRAMEQAVVEEVAVELARRAMEQPESAELQPHTEKELAQVISEGECGTS